jgi:hypothetical protein
MAYAWKRSRPTSPLTVTPLWTCGFDPRVRFRHHPRVGHDRDVGELVGGPERVDDRQHRVGRRVAPARYPGPGPLRTGRATFIASGSSRSLWAPRVTRQWCRRVWRQAAPSSPLPVVGQGRVVRGRIGLDHLVTADRRPRQFPQVGAGVTVAEDPAVLPGRVEPPEIAVHDPLACFVLCWRLPHLNSVHQRVESMSPKTFLDTTVRWYPAHPRRIGLSLLITAIAFAP